jgi:Putative sugar-binding domain
VDLSSSPEQSSGDNTSTELSPTKSPVASIVINGQRASRYASVIMVTFLAGTNSRAPTGHLCPADDSSTARDQRFRVCCSFGRGALPHHRGGAPPVLRREAAHFVDMSAPALVDAIGDVCSRFFNRAGQPVTFPCSERPLGLNLQPLMQIPV